MEIFIILIVVDYKYHTKCNEPDAISYSEAVALANRIW